MSNIEKIRAEIERLYGEYKDKFHRSGDSYHLGLIDGLDMAERVLDTFSEEPATNGYDEAYLNEKIAKASKTWEGVDVDKYMDEVRDREPDKSLEEAARLYAIPHYMKDIDVNHIEEYPYDTGLEAAFIAGAEWQEKRNEETIKTAEDHAFLAGADWQKEQMLKDAVEGIAHPDDCEIWINLVGYGYKFNDGDKVKLIVVKED